MDLWIIILVVSLVILLLVGFSIAFYILKKKNNKSLVNAPFIESLTLALGGKANIITIEIEQGRLKIEVNDLDLVNLEQIKILSGNGLFVTGNKIKVLFKDDAKTIKEALLK